MSQRTLTDADIAALTEALKGHAPATCHMGLTAEEVSTLKRFLRAFDSAAGIVGKAVLTSLVIALIGMFTKGFWISLATGVKDAVGGK